MRANIHLTEGRLILAAALIIIMAYFSIRQSQISASTSAENLIQEIVDE